MLNRTEKEILLLIDTQMKSILSLTMSAITAMVRTKMAAMAQVFRAHRVRSIHIEKETNLLENICQKTTSNDFFFL